MVGVWSVAEWKFWKSRNLQEASVFFHAFSFYYHFFIVCLIIFYPLPQAYRLPYLFFSSPGPSFVASFWGIFSRLGGRDDVGADEPKWTGAAVAAQPGCHVHMYLGLLTKSIHESRARVNELGVRVK